ncbi:MAG: serine/threonine-protein kinase [Gallionella sp.]|jgi:serine/threonine-protein kinase|nr:serine/threonine-protein kinase [Gallionella sp.]
MIRQLGRYEILQELGQGAMGVVYRARDPLIDRVVAIKTINLSHELDDKDRDEERFNQEARAAGRLSHPNIVTIHDIGKSGDIAYIAMEFLQGRELRDIMNEGEQLPVPQILAIATQVARGLAYAHEHDVVHRDIKPSNIMLIRDGHVKITDFGIARMSTSAVRTQTGMVLGSPKYMSPEQVLGKTIDARSDIFSLGVTLYEMLAGVAPFRGDNVNVIMYQTLNVTPPPPSSLNPQVPEMLDYILAKALDKNIESRYQTALEFAEDLRTCRETLLRTMDGQIGLPSEARDDMVFAKVIKSAQKPDVAESKDAMAATLKLSSAFDSTAATMRLAALTTGAADARAISDTLSRERIKTARTSSGAPNPAGNAGRARRRIGHWILVILLLLLISGIAVIFRL